MLKKTRRARNLEETKSPEAAEQPQRLPYDEGVRVLAFVCHPCIKLCMYSTERLGYGLAAA